MLYSLDLKIDDKYVDWQIFNDFCDVAYLPVVILHIGPYSQAFKYKEHTDGLTILGDCKHIREGCIIKPFVESYSNHCGRKILKSISAAIFIKEKR